METQKFVRKSFYVDAVLITADNMSDVADWCGGVIHKGQEGDYIQVSVSHAASERQTQGYVGDWVLKAGKQFKVYQEKAMRATFEPAGIRSKV